MQPGTATFTVKANGIRKAKGLQAVPPNACTRRDLNLRDSIGTVQEYYLKNADIVWKMEWETRQINVDVCLRYPMPDLMDHNIGNVPLRGLGFRVLHKASFHFVVCFLFRLILH